MMERKNSVVTPERFASGMTFAQYLGFIATPGNLAREGSRGAAARPERADARVVRGQAG